MKTLIASACTLLFFYTNAAAQCDVHKKTDDFTGKVSMYTDKVKIIKHGESPLLKSFDKNHSRKCFYKDYLQLMCLDGRMFLAMTEESDYCMCTMEAISIKFLDGKIIAKNKGKKGAMKQGETTNTQVVYFEITLEELAELASSDIDKVRINEGTGCPDHQVIQEELDDKATSAIKEFAKCMSTSK